MEILEVCLKTIYFQADDSRFLQKEGTTMGSCPSLVVSNIFMEHFEKLASTWQNRNDHCSLDTWMIHL